jgi:hypothetical protein
MLETLALQNGPAARAMLETLALQNGPAARAMLETLAVSASRAMREALTMQSGIFGTAMSEALKTKTGLLSSGLPNLLSEVSMLGAHIFEQTYALNDLPSLALDSRVIQATRGWRLGTRPKEIVRSTESPSAIIDLGLSVQAVNTAAYVTRAERLPKGAPWSVARASETDSLLAWLESVDPRLPRKYQGAWNAVGRRGPDWISQAANSGVELLDWVLRKLAPDQEVIRWQVESGKFSDELSENGRPHRPLRVRYIAHSRSLPASSVDLLIKAVAGTLSDLQKLKHADDESMAASIRMALVALEYCLLMIRGGT